MSQRVYPTPLDDANRDHCQGLEWRFLHIGPVRRDWPRCSRCNAYLTRTEMPDGGRYYIRHIEEDRSLEARDE